MSKLVQIGLTVLAALVGMAAFWFLVPRSASFGMFQQEGGGPNVARLVFSFVSTITGVVLGSAYRQLRHLQSTGVNTISDMSRFTSDLTRSIDLWLGLAGAPIVYALLLQSTNGMSLPGLLLVALENGFCCLLIVNSFVGRTESSLAPKEETKPQKPPTTP
jgi:hypothetical protein